MGFFRNNLKKIIEKNDNLSRWVRFFHRKKIIYTTLHPKWMIQTKDFPSVRSNTSPKVLIATSVGAYMGGTIMESTLGLALALRGAEIHTFLCDSVLPACMESQVRWYPKIKNFIKNGPQADLCKDCFLPANELYQSLGFKTHRYSDYLSQEDFKKVNYISSNLSLEEMTQFKYEDISIGEHALAGTLRFFARATLDDEPLAFEVLQRYFKAALLTALATQKLFKSYAFESAVFHHGIYVPQGIIGEIARKENVRVINWNPAYRKKCFIFSHNDTYHHTLMTESVENWKNINWNKTIEDTVLEYLKSRWQGTQDWIWFHEKPQVDLTKIEVELNIDFSKPCIGMLTNVMWDAQLHYPANAFPNMLDWVLETISYFIMRPDLQLIIRIHPAEIRGTLPSRQAILTEIQRKFPHLPSNVFIIPPESNISTYMLMLQCDTVLIYGTKTGVELTSMGIPVIVAGEAWIRGKGVTLDASSKKHYFSLLDNLPLGKKLTPELITKARKYAYHFFFRRMIPLEFMEPSGKAPPFKLNINNVDHLKAGSDKGLDIICNGILKGSDFIYQHEKFIKY